MCVCVCVILGNISILGNVYQEYYKIIIFLVNYLYPKQSRRYCSNGGNTIVPIALPDIHKPFATPRSFSKYDVTM